MMGENGPMIFDRHTNLKYFNKYGNQHFWARVNYHTKKAGKIKWIREVHQTSTRGKISLKEFVAQFAIARI